MHVHQNMITIGIRRPVSHAPREQRVIPIRDNSPSMEGEKWRAASNATSELCRILALPVNENAFWMAVVDFAKRATIVNEFERVTKLVDRLHPLRAGRLGVGTNITSGLEAAQTLLKNPERNPQENIEFLHPVLVLLSDGAHNSGPEPYATANQLKQSADIICVAFGQDADENSLRRIATSPQHFVRCASGEELRGFFTHVGVTLTQTLAARSSATAALVRWQER